MKKIFLLFMALSMFYSQVISTAIAAEDSFTVTAEIISSDTTPPSVPSGLSATGISVSQIDLTWNASTDNVGATNYKVFRDLVFVGNSNTTSFSDIGLNDNTSYSYTISAQDGAGNTSSISSSVTGTTLASPVSENTPSGRSDKTSLSPRFLSMDITLEKDYAVLHFNTDVLVQAKIYWGKTPDYEIGSLAGLVSRKNHEIKIENLEPTAKYYYKIEITDNSGKRNSFTGEFYLVPPPQKEFPLNPNKFQITEKNGVFVLDWTKPEIENFNTFRVVRSETFFPKDPFDGRVVYEGGADTYIDEDLSKNVTYFYTVFIRDKEGNYSSGIVNQKKYGSGEDNPIYILQASPLQDEKIKDVSLASFTFFQSNKNISFVGNALILDASQGFTISIDDSSLSNLVRTVVIEIQKDDSKSEVPTFLLRINKEKIARIATFAAIEKEGIYPIAIKLLDHKNRLLKSVEGVMFANVISSEFGSSSVWKKITDYVKNAPEKAAVAFSVLSLIPLVYRRLWI